MKARQVSLVFAVTSLIFVCAFAQVSGLIKKSTVVPKGTYNDNRSTEYDSNNFKAHIHSGSINF